MIDDSPPARRRAYNRNMGVYRFYCFRVVLGAVRLAACWQAAIARRIASGAIISRAASNAPGALCGAVSRHACAISLFQAGAFVLRESCAIVSHLGGRP